MDEIMKLLMMSGLEDLMKQVPKEKLKSVDVSKVKEQMTQKSIEDGAVHIKRMYDALIKAGFNEVQAFELVKVQLSVMRLSR